MAFTGTGDLTTTPRTIERRELLKGIFRARSSQTVFPAEIDVFFARVRTDRASGVKGFCRSAQGFAGGGGPGCSSVYLEVWNVAVG